MANNTTQSVATGTNTVDISPYSTFTYDWTELASREYFDRYLRLGWSGNRAGEVLGTALLKDTDTARQFEINLDSDYLGDHAANFVIRRSGGIGASFSSREADDASLRPYLEVTYSDGLTKTFDATRDTYIESTTSKSMGANDTVSTKGDILIAFDEFQPTSSVASARLILTTTDKQFGNQDISVYSPDIQPAALQDFDVPVVSEDDFYISMTGAEILAGNDHERYNVRGDIADGVSLPYTDTAFNKVTEFTSNSDTIYAVELIRFDKSFDPSFGGKSGGLANTHMSGLDVSSPNGPGGWGGRNADGDSYAFRLNFNEYDETHPLADDYLSLGSYAYYIDNGTSHGRIQPGTVPVPKDEFVALQHMVKLNTVYEDGTSLSDGEFALWVNGKLSVHLTGLKIRDYSFMKSQVSFEEFLELSRVHSYWHDVYFGGVGYNNIDHDPHLVSLGQLWVGEGVPDEATIIARLAELNAAPPPNFWGAAEGYNEVAEDPVPDDLSDDDQIPDEDIDDDHMSDDEDQDVDSPGEPDNVDGGAVIDEETDEVPLPVDGDNGSADEDQPDENENDSGNDNDNDNNGGNANDGGNGAPDEQPSQLPNVEELIEIGDEGVFVASSAQEHFVGRDGDDLLQGTADNFDGDLISNFSADDIVLIEGTRSDVLSSRQNGDHWSVLLSDNRELYVTLESGLEGGGLQLLHVGAKGVYARYVEGITNLEEATAVLDDKINGIITQDYLSYENSNAFEITLAESEAGYANSLGVYEVADDGSISNVRIVSEDVGAQDGPVIVDGLSQGATLHFFLLQDGATRLSAATLASDQLDIEVVDGTAVLTDAGVDVSATIFVTHDGSLNADGEVHALSGLSSDGGLTVGFEDLLRGEGGLSDNDFQDVVFTVEALAPTADFIG
jgi:hypothetical protein|tara:strand:+ start:159986 stop:162685 length:2700 start_codon:yes stop_codon:yes gene_type:complete